MLKTFGRILIILTIASLIGLGWYAFSMTSIGSQFTSPDKPAGFAPPGNPPGEMSESRPARPEGDDMSFSLTRLLAGMVGKLVITAVVVVLVVLLRRLINRFAVIRFKFAEINR